MFIARIIPDRLVGSTVATLYPLGIFLPRWESKNVEDFLFRVRRRPRQPDRNGYTVRE